MDSLKIAFYSDTYLPAVDGVVTSMLNLKKELERRGHKVYIFTSGSTSSKKQYASKRVFIMQGVTFKPYPQYKIALFPYPSLLKREFPTMDIIHVQTPFSMGLAGMLASKLWNIPVIGTYHTMIVDKNIINNYYPKNKRLKKVTTKYMQKYAKFFYSRCRMTFVPTETIKRILAKQGITNTMVVPNSIDLEIFNPKVSGAKVRKALKIGQKDKMILYVGRTSMEKRLDTLLLAVKHLNKKRKDIKVVICGTGPAFDYYKRMAARLGLHNVKFTGFIDNHELPKYYAACNALCLPSTFETQGMVAIEAMALGKPVVGADFLALKELIKNGKNGERFKAGDYVSCSNKIERVLNNSGAYTQEALRTARSYSLDKVADKVLEAYKLILSEAN